MKYFDTHAHLNFPDYDKDRDEVVKKSLKEGFSIINIGTDMKENRKVLDIAKNYKEGVYASVGLHPLHIEDEEFLLDNYRELTKEEKVVAIGETGLDYKEKDADKEKQKKVLKSHISLAEETNLPMIFHCRMAHEDFYKVLKEDFNGKGVVHCFSGGRKEARNYLEMGLFLGINGIIFKMNLEKVIKEVPMEKILLETDCPFLSPIKDVKRNEPIFIKYIAKEVARIKGIKASEVLEVATNNARNLFNI